MDAPRESRDQPPPLPTASPRDPRERLPPNLAKYCPDPAIVKQQARLWADKCFAFLRHWLKRFRNACARNWWALDRTGRLFVACLGVVSLCCALLAIAGWSRKQGDETWNLKARMERNTDDADRDKGHTDRG